MGEELHKLVNSGGADPLSSKNNILNYNENNGNYNRNYIKLSCSGTRSTCLEFVPNRIETLVVKSKKSIEIWIKISKLKIDNYNQKPKQDGYMGVDLTRLLFPREWNIPCE